MSISLGSYPFSKILGWSHSRYELFKKCKRAYFYNYYGKFCSTTPFEKINFLKRLTTVPLEVGNIVHHVIETFLKRLQKSDAPIDTDRFLQFALDYTAQMFESKEFLEVYYKQVSKPDLSSTQERIRNIMSAFMKSDMFQWIYTEAINEKAYWIIEPGGYGETRINNLKAYCKMDFLFPVENTLYILDWKSGKQDIEKHTNQLLGYAASVQSENPSISVEAISPQIVYMNEQEVSSYEISITDDLLDRFKERLQEQTNEMYQFCSDVESNRPIEFEKFTMTENKNSCNYCSYKELCTPSDTLPF